jgi:hypothetical protein
MKQIVRDLELEINFTMNDKKNIECFSANDEELEIVYKEIETFLNEKNDRIKSFEKLLSDGIITFEQYKQLI